MRFTEDQYRDLLIAQGKTLPEKPKKKSKYGSERIQVDGIWFDSRKEANRYCDLKVLTQAGEVIQFFRQVPIDLPGGIVYRLDFLVLWAGGRIGYEDTKGYRTPEYKLKKKQVEALYPIKIEEL